MIWLVKEAPEMLQILLILPQQLQNSRTRGNDMDKLTFDDLGIEITRRCNMTCGHCLRGEAENVHLSREYVDQLLAQTEMIGALDFFGGEPTLNVDIMEYILDQLYERGIPVLQFGMVTNGLICNDRIINVLKGYSELIQTCRETCCKQAELAELWDYTRIGVSFDSYHKHRETCEQNYERYKRELAGYASVTKHRVGEFPHKAGRAVELGLYDKSFLIEKGKKETIEILDATHKPICPSYNSYKLIHQKQKVVCCAVEMDVHGVLWNRSIFGNGSYLMMRENEAYSICNVSAKSIWNEIIRYNSTRNPCCYVQAEYLDELKELVRVEGGIPEWGRNELSEYEKRLEERDNEMLQKLEPLLEEFKNNPLGKIIIRAAQSFDRAENERKQKVSSPQREILEAWQAANEIRNAALKKNYFDFE